MTSRTRSTGLLRFPHHPESCEGCRALARLRDGFTDHRTILRAMLDPRMLAAGLAGALIGWVMLGTLLLVL